MVVVVVVAVVAGKNWRVCVLVQVAVLGDGLYAQHGAEVGELDAAPRPARQRQLDEVHVRLSPGMSA